MNETSFSNDNVSIDAMTSIDNQPFTPLNDAYFKANLVIRTSVVLVLVIALFVTKYQPFADINSTNQYFLNVIIVGVVALGALAVTLGYLRDRAKRYNIRELDLSFSSGLIFKKIVTQPLLRLQHIELKRGPVERKIGLATIQVFSAGGVQHTFSLPGLTVEQATHLRQYILEHKDVTLHE